MDPQAPDHSRGASRGRTRSPRSLERLAPFVALVLSACNSGLVQFHGTITKTKMQDGQMVTETQEFDNWADMKAALEESFREFRATAREIVAKLVEAPPPGEVKLSDLSPALASYEGHERLDFLTQARAKGEGDRFQYVRIGVPSYDTFFQEAAELYAFVYETKLAVQALRVLCKARLGGRANAKMKLGDLVRLAAGGDVAASADAELSELRDLSKHIAGSAPQFVGRVQGLIASGQQLVTGAPTSILDPRTVAHMDLIVKGLGQSVRVVGDAGKLLVKIDEDLATL